MQSTHVSRSHLAAIAALLPAVAADHDGSSALNLGHCLPHYSSSRAVFGTGGANYFDSSRPEATTKRLVKRLQNLGYKSLPAQYHPSSITVEISSRISFLQHNRNLVHQVVSERGLNGVFLQYGWLKPAPSITSQDVFSCLGSESSALPMKSGRRPL